MNQRAEIARLSAIAREHGAKVECNDYDWSCAAMLPSGEWIRISYAFRAERDDYTGYKLITEEALLDFLKGEDKIDVGDTRL